jgi:hypothetical protein
MDKPPTYKKVDAQRALDAANMVAARLRGMRDAKTMEHFIAMRSALAFDLNDLNLKTQTL